MHVELTVPQAKRISAMLTTQAGEDLRDAVTRLMEYCTAMTVHERTADADWERRIARIQGSYDGLAAVDRLFSDAEDIARRPEETEAEPEKEGERGTTWA